MIGVNVGVPAPMAVFSFSGWNQSFFGDLHVQTMEGVRFSQGKRSQSSAQLGRRLCADAGLVTFHFPPRAKFAKHSPHPMTKAYTITSSVIIVGLCVAVALEARTIVELNHRLAEAEAKAVELAKHARADQEKNWRRRAEHNDVLRNESEALRVRLGAGEAGARGQERSGGEGRSQVRRSAQQNVQ